MAETLSCFDEVVRIWIMQLAVYFRLWEVYKGTGPSRQTAGNTPVTQQGGIITCRGKEEPTQWGSRGWLCWGRAERESLQDLGFRQWLWGRFVEARFALAWMLSEARVIL